MRRSEIRWYKFYPPDKNRPVLILSRNPVIEYLGEVTIAPVTTTIRDIPSEVLLTKADGLPRECVVNCDHLHSWMRLLTQKPHQLINLVQLRFGICRTE
jgi:mRNA interferase MazF